MADRDRLGDRRQLHGHRARCRSSRARRPGRCPAGTCKRARRATARRCRRRDRRHRRQAAAAAGLPARPCGTPTSATRAPTWRSSPATTRPATPAMIDEDGYVYVMAAPTTSSTSPATGCRPAAWRRCWPTIPDVAECAVIGVADQLKGQLPLGFLVLKAGVERGRRGDRQGGGADGARAHRSGGRLQAGHRGRAPAQDPLGQDPARHHEDAVEVHFGFGPCRKAIRLYRPSSASTSMLSWI